MLWRQWSFYYFDSLKISKKPFFKTIARRSCRPFIIEIESAVYKLRMQVAFSLSNLTILIYFSTQKDTKYWYPLLLNPSKQTIASLWYVTLVYIFSNSSIRINTIVPLLHPIVISFNSLYISPNILSSFFSFLSIIF